MKQTNTSLTIQYAGNKSKPAGFKSGKSLFTFIVRNIVPGIFTLLGFFGVVFTELGFDTDSAAFLLMTISGSLLFLLTVFLSVKVNAYSVERMAAVLAVLVTILIFREQLLESLAYWFNAVKKWIYLNTGVFQQQYDNEGNMWIAAIIIVIVTALLTEFLSRACKGRLALIPAACYLILVITGFAGFNVWGILFLMGTALILETGLPVSGKTALASFLLLLVCAAVFMAVLMAFGGVNAELSIKNSAAKLIHGILYESGGTGLTEGSLSNLGAKESNGTKELTVTMSEPHAEYIKAFTGADYNGQEWEPLSAEETEEDAELLYSLQSSGFYASSQLFLAAQFADEAAEDESTEKLTLTVNNEQACRYFEYLPYGADTSSVLVPENITREGAKTGTMENIEFELYPIENVYRYMTALSELYDSDENADYFVKEAAYRDFVYEHYLDVPDNIASLLEEYGISGSEGISTTQARSETTKALASVLTYDESAVTENGNTDFLTFVLDFSKKGYDVHYASLAVMIMRSFGIPARYAEGYLISSSDAASIPDHGTYEITDKNAHAWVEIYLDGIGWIVYDPTPGFTSEINYELPEGDETAENAVNALSRNNYSDEDQEEEQEQERKQVEHAEDSGFELKPEVLLTVVMIIILIILAAYIIRTVLLRKRLKKQRMQMLKGRNLRVSSAAVFMYTRRLLAYSCRVAEQDVFLDKDGAVSRYLQITTEEMNAVKDLMEEIWLSSHEVTAETRKSAVSWLKLVEKKRKEKAGILSKFVLKYIKCIEY